MAFRRGVVGGKTYYGGIFFGGKSGQHGAYFLNYFARLPGLRLARIVMVREAAMGCIMGSGLTDGVNRGYSLEEIPEGTESEGAVRWIPHAGPFCGIMAC